MRKTFLPFLAMLLFSTALLAQAGKKTADQYHYAIDSAMGEADYDFALAQCNELLQMNPSDSIGNIRKIPILYSLHRIDDFMVQVKKVFPIADSAAQMLAAFSLEREDREKTDSAAVWHDRDKVVTEALKLGPKNVYANVSKSLLLSEAGKQDESIVYINKAIEYADAETKPGIRLIKSSLYSDYDQKDKAIGELKDMIQEDPDYEPAYTQLSTTYRKFKMYPEALAILEEHSKMFDMEKDDRSSKYYILRDMGNKAEACNVAEELGEDENYIMDDAAQKLGCAFLLAPLKKEGKSTYEYQVVAGLNQYIFSAEKNEGAYAKGNLKINWSMAQEDEDLHKGTVMMTKAALDTAHEMLNRFTNGKDYYLDTRTTVWVSRAVFDDIIKKGESKINADGVWRTYKLVANDADESYYYGMFSYNDETGKRLQLLHIMSDDDMHYEIWINNDRDNPLIAKMILDFTITLDKIEE